VWDSAGKPVPVADRENVSSELALSADGRYAASQAEAGVRLWDLGTGLPLGKPIEVGERGSMGVAFVKTKQGEEVLVYTTNHLRDPDKADNLDQVRLLKL